MIRNRRFVLARLIPLALVLLAACAPLDLKDQDVKERIAMHAASTWALGDATNLNPEGRKFYEGFLKGKEVFLTPKELRVRGLDFRLELHPVNQKLNCTTESLARVWPCVNPRDAKVAEGISDSLRRCINRASSAGYNFAAITPTGVCLNVALTERRKARDSKDRPTNIEHDRILIELTGGDGPVATGLVPGRPRPNFIDPESR